MDRKIADFLVELVMKDIEDKDVGMLTKMVEERPSWDSEKYFIFVRALAVYTFKRPHEVLDILAKYLDTDSITTSTPAP